MKLNKLLLALGIFTVSAPLFAGEITVFGAASMTNALQQIADEYSKNKPDDKIIFSFASSSTLAKQIAEGAPADIFVSANTKWLKFLQEKSLTVTGTEKVLVGNELVMIAPKQSAVQNVDIAKGEWLATLNNNYLSVGDPDHVPAGQYMKAAMQKLDLWEKVEDKLARAKDVRAALALVERAESPLGVVYSTDAKQSEKVKIVATFPVGSYPQIEYPVALIKEHDNQDSRNFYNYLTSAEAKKIFEKYGFSVK